MTIDFLSLDQQPEAPHYVGGRYLADVKGQSFHSIFPATGETIATLNFATSDVIANAVQSAIEAQRIWAAYSAEEKSAVLRRAAEIMRQENEELAQLETLDTGKPIQETRVADPASGAECLDYFAALVRDMNGDYIQYADAYAYTVREPLGVCLGIGAWNYPIQIASWKSAPALACGNAMIFKPSEVTPLTALKLAEIYTRAGLPDGVFNVVQGDGSVAQQLLEHQAVAKVSITGSTQTGIKVMQSAAKDLTKVSLELGGKSPLIIFPDADIDKAVNAAVDANFYSSGQVCSNGTRVFVHRDIKARFLAALKARIDTITLGDPRQDDTVIGPMVSQVQYDAVKQYIQLGIDEGANLSIGGEIETDTGLFIRPVVFTEVQDEMTIAKEEIFGPVMSVLDFTDEADVIVRANNTEYGLSAGVVTENLSTASRVIQQLQAGTCWVNSYNLTPVEMPFGGFKKSGIGRENGRAAIEQYSQIKSVYVAL